MVNCKKLYLVSLLTNKLAYILRQVFPNIAIYFVYNIVFIWITIEYGFKWVGPIRLFSLPATTAERNAWMAETIERIKPAIAKWFPEYGFPETDPFSLNKFDYSQKIGPVTIILAAKNIKIDGFSNFKEVKLTLTNENDNTCYFNITVPEISITANYKAGGTAVLFPITGAGPLYAKASKDTIICGLFLKNTILNNAYTKIVSLMPVDPIERQCASPRIFQYDRSKEGRRNWRCAINGNGYSGFEICPPQYTIAWTFWWKPYSE